MSLCRGAAFLAFSALLACARSPSPVHAGQGRAAVAPSASAPPDPEPFRATRPPSGEPGTFSYPAPIVSRLPNGFSVFAIPRKGRVVTLRLVVSHGAGSVPEGKSGVAGLTARLLTESTRRKSSLALAEAVESLGTTLSADAGRDESSVSLLVLPDQVPRALALLSEVVTEPLFSPVEFERVRAEWLDGLKSERQEPQRLATLTAVRALFGPVLGAPVDGRLSDVSKLTVADVRDFHRSAYTPDRAALIVVGDIDPQKLDPQVTPLFGRWQGKSTLPAPAAAAPSVPEKTKVLIVDRLSAVQSAVVAIQPFPNRSAPGHEAREILGRVLGGLFTSRLNMNLREKHGYTYGAFAQPVESRVWGALVVSTSVRTDATADSLHEIELELRRMRNPSLGAPLTPDELHRAKADLVYKLGETLEHPSTIAETSSEIFVEGLPLDYDSRYPSLVAGISADAVNSAARDIAPERLLFVIVGDRSQIEPELVRRGYSVELAPAAFTE